MRDAAIGGLSAFDAVRPRKGAGGTGRPGSAKRPTGWGPRWRRFRARAALIVGSAGLSAIMIGIILNATLMQKGHHPAPLFATAPAPVPAPRPADPPAQAIPPPPAASPAPRPDPIAAAVEAPAAVPAASPARAPAHAAAPAHKAKAEDGIARLLAGGSADHAGVARKRPATPVKVTAAHHAGAPATSKGDARAARPVAGKAGPLVQ